MRTVPGCPACGTLTGIASRVANEEQRRRYLTFSELKYGGLLRPWLKELQLVVCRCPRCGHHWYRDQPASEQLAAMYAAGRPILQPGPVVREATEAITAEMRRLRRLTTASHPSLLDYGSGFGRWARGANEAGFDVYAYEPSARRGGEEAPPFRLVHELSDIEDRTFDAVNVEQVLEHVPDPIATLRQIRRFCTADTIVRITVPNILRPLEGSELWSSWPFDGRRPHTLAPFEHLHGFTPSSLRHVVRRAGLQSVGWMHLVGVYPILVVRRIADTFRQALGATLILARPDRAMAD